MVAKLPEGVIYEVANGFFHIEDRESELSFLDNTPLGPSLMAYSQGLFPEYERKEQTVYKKKVSEALYLASVQNGEERRYRRDGTVISSSFYRKGKLHGPSECYYPDGLIASRTYFIDSQREGRAHFFDKEERLVCDLCWKCGQLHGKQKFYFSNGKTKSVLPYLQGLFDGQLQLFFPDGTLKREIFMSQGKRHGLDCLWDSSGTIFFAFEYENGLLVKTQIKDPIAIAYKL